MVQRKERAVLLVQCDQQDLRLALAACARLAPLDPWLPGVTFVARISEGGGLLLVESWSPRAAAGVRVTLPALVALSGRLLVPFQPLTHLVALLRPGMMQLSRGQVSPENALAPFVVESLPTFTADPVLVLEQESTSTRGTRLLHQSRLRAVAAEGQEQASRQPFEHEHSLALAQVAVQAWQEALAPCLLLTKEHATPSDAQPDVNHALVLVCFAPEHLRLIASTPQALVTGPLPFLGEASAPVPFPYALFPGDVLAWICRCLTESREAGPVTLALLPDEEQEEVDLLVSTALATYVCRGTRKAIPLVWNQPFALPASVELLVPRVALVKALATLAVAKQQRGWNKQVQFLVEGQELVVRWTTEHRLLGGQQSIPLEEEMPLAPVWVDLARCRSLLGRLQGATVSLQFGSLQARHPDGPLGFLRLSSPGHTQVFMMTLSILTPGAEAPTAEEPPVEKGVALAHA